MHTHNTQCVPNHPSVLWKKITAGTESVKNIYLTKTNNLA